MGLFSRLVTVFKSKVSSVVDRAEDPRELVEYAYTQQQELLRKTKQGLVEVATARTRLEQQVRRLRSDLVRLEQQAAKALSMGREDLARVALQRKQSVLGEIETLEAQIEDVSRQETQLTQTEQQLEARVEEFRVTKGSIVARYSAAQAQVRVSEAISGVSGQFADLGMALGRAVEKTENMQARAEALGGLIDTGSLAMPMGSDDPIGRELEAASNDAKVEEELAALKAANPVRSALDRPRQN